MGEKIPIPKARAFVAEVINIEGPISLITLANLLWKEASVLRLFQQWTRRKASSTPIPITKKGVIHIMELKGTPVQPRMAKQEEKAKIGARRAAKVSRI